MTEPWNPNPKAPAGTTTGTVWIWIIVFLPLLSIGSLFLLDFGAYFRDVMTNPTSLQALLSFYVSPGFLILVFGSWALYGLTVVFAALDVRELKRRQVPRPFHWAFAFLGTLVYTIGRSVVVQRRTGAGLGPLWAMIAVYLFSIVVSIVWSFLLIAQVVAVVPQYVPLTP